MKKLLLIIAMLFAYAGSVYADASSAGTPTRAELEALMKQLRQDIKENSAGMKKQEKSGAKGEKKDVTTAKENK